MTYKDLAHRCLLDIKQIGTNLLFLIFFREGRK